MTKKIGQIRQKPVKKIFQKVDFFVNFRLTNLITITILTFASEKKESEAKLTDVGQSPLLGTYFNFEIDKETYNK